MLLSIWGKLCQAYSAFGRILNLNLEILLRQEYLNGIWKCLRVNTYILTSLARRARWTTSTCRTLGKWETHCFVNAILRNFLKKIFITKGEKYSQFDQAHQAHQEVLGNLEGPKKKQYVTFQAFI